MRISGLAERTGVPVATLKYYLREGLLHAGTATARTQAVYDTTHVERVRLGESSCGQESVFHGWWSFCSSGLDPGRLARGNH